MGHCFTEVAGRPLDTLAARVHRSGRPLGLACSVYFPLEMLDAFGLEGAMLPPLPREGFPRADAVLQSFTCAYVRSAVDELLRHSLPVGVVACTSGCDSQLAMAGVLAAAGIEAPVISLRLPIITGSPLARRQAEVALKEFSDRLSTALSRSLDPDLLARSAALRNNVRGRVAALFDSMKNMEADPAFVYAAAIASMVMQPHDFLDAAMLPPPEPTAIGIPATLSGSLIPSIELVSDLASLGIHIVHDDTEIGTRGASRRLPQVIADPIEAIAESLTDGMVHGPTRIEGRRARIERVVEDAKAARVKVAILAHYKYCDPHAFEAPRLMEALRRAGIHSITVELDREPGLPPRERTKVQTLMEAIA